MKGIERHKAIHMLSGPSAGYLALIIRCRFYFLLLQTSRCDSFYAIMLPHAGVLYHANALSSFCENNRTKTQDRSAYFAPPVRGPRARQSSRVWQERAKHFQIKRDKRISLSLKRTALIRNVLKWVNGFRLKAIAALVDKPKYSFSRSQEWA